MTSFLKFVDNFLSRVNCQIQKHSFIAAILYVAAVFVFLLSSFQITYMSNDDTGMMLWLRGIGLTERPSVNILFMNIIYASFIKTLYEWFDAIDWYPLIFLAVLFISYNYLSYLIFKYVQNIYFKVLYVAVLLSICPWTIVTLQFTIVAGVAGMAGLFGLFTSKNNLEKLIAFSLLFVSFLIRIESFFLAVIMFLPFYSFKIFHWYSVQKSKKNFYILLKENVWIWKLVGIIVVAWLFNYYSIISYGDYYQFNAKRGKIHDYGILEKISPGMKQKILQEVNWSFNDYAMLMSWFFHDKKVYNEKSFDRIVSYIPRKKVHEILYFIFNKENLNTVLSAFSHPFINSFTLFIVAFGIFYPSVRNIFFLTSVFLYFWLVYYLVAFFLKAPPERVWIPMLLTSYMVSYAFHVNFTEQSIVSKFKSGYIKLIFLIFSLYPLQKITVHIYETIKQFSVEFAKSDRQPLKEAIEKFVVQYPNAKLIVSWREAFPVEVVKPFEKDISYLKRIKIFFLGSSQQSPELKEILSNLNISDLYLAISERKDVYVLILKRFSDLHPILYQTYMQEHYGKNVTWQFLPNPFTGILRETELVKFSVVSSSSGK